MCYRNIQNEWMSDSVSSSGGDSDDDDDAYRLQTCVLVCVSGEDGTRSHDDHRWACSCCHRFLYLLVDILFIKGHANSLDDPSVVEIMTWMTLPEHQLNGCSQCFCPNTRTLCRNYIWGVHIICFAHTATKLHCTFSVVGPSLFNWLCFCTVLVPKGPLWLFLCSPKNCPFQPLWGLWALLISSL